MITFIISMVYISGVVVAFRLTRKAVKPDDWLDVFSLFFLAGASWVSALIAYVMILDPYNRKIPNWLRYSPSEPERRTERRNDAASEPQPPVTKKQNKIKEIWKHKWEILKALWTLYFDRNPAVRKTIQTRRIICRSNACKKFDLKGQSEKVIWKGKHSCSICGCNVLLKASYLPGECALKEVDQEPLWKAFGPSKE